MQATIIKSSRFRCCILLSYILGTTSLFDLSSSAEKAVVNNWKELLERSMIKKIMSVSLFGQRNYRRVCAKVFITAIWRTQLITS